MPRPNDKIGPYILISKLGRGAFGVVWLAEKRTAITTTKVAIKIPNDEDVDLEAVKQEASLWVHASGHPNVLPIIDADIHEEQIIIVSEYAPDGSLSKWLEKHGGKAPSIESAVEMTLGILAGLEHLHKRGIIHRDLKPDNILLQNETPRLADFGIARILKTTAKSTIATGTPAYMPPEAFDGKRSVQTDIWSVGVVFYQLLAGRLPFQQIDISSLLMAIVTKEPEPLLATIPNPIQAITDKALKKNPAERYGSAHEMRQALREAVQKLTLVSNKEAQTEILPSDPPPTITFPVQTSNEQERQVRPVLELGLADPPELTGIQKLQLEYWTAFTGFLRHHNTFLKLQKPQAQQWMPFSVGRGNFLLASFINRKGRRISVGLTISGPYAKAHFHLLHRDREVIEREIGEPLEWKERATSKESHVRLHKYKTDPANRDDWPVQHEWLQDKLENFHNVFAPRIKTLNANEYASEENVNNLLQITPTIASPAIISNSPFPTSPASLQSGTASTILKPYKQDGTGGKRVAFVSVGLLVIAMLSIGIFFISKYYSNSSSDGSTETTNTPQTTTNTSKTNRNNSVLTGSNKTTNTPQTIADTSKTNTNDSLSTSSTTGGRQDFALVNRTGVEINKVFISPHDSDDWQEDVLGRDALPDGQSVEIKFHRNEKASMWDLRVEDKRGNAIEWENLNLREISKITLRYRNGRATAETE